MVPVPNAAATEQPQAARHTALAHEAAAETDAGLGIPLDDIEQWVASWDTPGERPMPKARPVL